MPATWPATLPQKFQRDGFSQGSAERRISSQPDTGPARVRPRTSAAIVPMNGTVELTVAQVAILSAFVRDDLAGGSMPFTFPDPFEGAALLVRFDPKQTLPAYSNLGAGNWTADLRLEILP